MTFHTLRAGGYLGTKQPAKTSKQTKQTILINEKDWDHANLLMPIAVREEMRKQQETILINEKDWTAANLLMPMDVREIMWNQREKAVNNELRSENAQDGTPKQKSKILPLVCFVR